MGLYNWWKYRKFKRFGNHIFTFPDGQKLYQLKEDHFEKLPNVKLEYIQENTNYIAHLGVSKQTLFAAVDKTETRLNEMSVVMKMKGYKDSQIDLARLLGEALTVIKYIKSNTAENEKIQEHILVSMFDMFFFFEGENIFEWSEEALEKKRFYLNEYPYFRNFFFRKLENYSTAYKDTYDNVIRYAIIQTGIQSVIQDLIFTDLQEAKTD